MFCLIVSTLNPESNSWTGIHRVDDANAASLASTGSHVDRDEMIGSWMSTAEARMLDKLVHGFLALCKILFVHGIEDGTVEVFQRFFSCAFRPAGRVSQVVNGQTTRENKDIFGPQNVYRFSHSIIIVRLQTPVHTSLHDRDVGEFIAKHKLEGYEDAMVQAWS